MERQFKWKGKNTIQMERQMERQEHNSNGKAMKGSNEKRHLRHFHT
jgi:hypothetical protein